MASPSALLGLSHGDDGGNHFMLQESRSSEGSIREVELEDLLTYDSPPYYTLNAAGTKAQFRSPANGPKTSTSAAGARNEFRECNPDGTWAAWDPFDGGTHYIKAKSTVTYHPTDAVANIGVVIGQLHNGTESPGGGSVAAFRTQFITSSVRLRYRVNGSAVQGTSSGTFEIVPAQTLSSPTASGTIIQTEFEWMLKCYNGNGSTCTLEFWINGALWHTSTALAPTVDGDTFYFKIGSYNQFESADVGSTDYAQAEHRDIEHWHTGWAEPGSGGEDPGGEVGAGPVQFRAASGANQGSGTSLSVAKPTGVVQGDLMVAVQTQDADDTVMTPMTAPAGWSLIGSQVGGVTTSRSPQVKVWQKIAGASEGSTYAFGDSTNTNHAVVILAFQTGSFDPATPIAAGPTFQTSQGSAATTSHIAPSVTGVAGGMLVTAHCADTNGTAGSYTQPSGMDERQDTAAGYVNIGANTLLLTAGGATGTKTATNTRSSGYNCVTLVINPPPSKAPLLIPRIRRLRHLLVR